MTPKTTTAFALIMLALSSPRVVAQQYARIEGVVTDSAHNKPLSEATIFVSRVAPAQADSLRAIITDSNGRYSVDSLVAGRYSIYFSHPAADSLDLPIVAREVVLASGDRARVDLAIPSGATLRRVACPGLQLPDKTGAIIGTATDADTDRPLAGASVVVSWNEMSVDRSTLQAIMTPRTGRARVDSTGIYRLCGVPTDEYLLLQVQKDGRAGSALRADVSDSVGFKRLDLTFSANASRELVSAAANADTAEAAPLTGTAALTGTVRSSTGVPLADVLIRVEGAARSARTDSVGRFRLDGLPAGSQLVEARRVGFFIGHQSVALRSGRAVDVQLSIGRIVSLDSIRVVAQRSRYREFEQHRRSPAGKFFSEEQIADRHALDTSDLLRLIPGFRVVGLGEDAKVTSTRSARPCSPNVMIDNFPNQALNIVRPRDIGAMEVYNDAAGGPPGQNRGCGVIVIWTKR